VGNGGPWRVARTNGGGGVPASLAGTGGAEAGGFERGVPVLRGLAKGDPQAGV